MRGLVTFLLIVGFWLGCSAIVIIAQRHYGLPAMVGGIVNFILCFAGTLSILQLRRA